MLDKSEKIFVAGHRGMVGSALVRRLESEGFSNLLVCDRSKLDLKDESAVAKFFADEKPVVVILAAAKVGGIKANNDHPVEFLLENFRHQEHHKAAALTARERSVVKLVAEGHPNKVTSAMLNLSTKTVEIHRAAAMRKLGLSSTAELVRYAIREKFITP